MFVRVPPMSNNPSTPSARRSRDRLALEHGLPANGLRLDDWCLRLDDERLGHTADTHLAIDRDDTGAADGDVLTARRAEAGKGERDGIRTRAEIDQLILPRSVGHRATHFLDERGAGRFNSDAGQHGA